MINSLPITPASSDPNVLEALTPGHLLHGGPGFPTQEGEGRVKQFIQEEMAAYASNGRKILEEVCSGVSPNTTYKAQSYTTKMES